MVQCAEAGIDGPFQVGSDRFVAGDGGVDVLGKEVSTDRNRIEVLINVPIQAESALIRNMPPQQNLWVDSGSGSAPS